MFDVSMAENSPVFCQVCSADCSDPSCEETYCEKNSIVVCSTVHQVRLLSLTLTVCQDNLLDRGHHRKEAAVRWWDQSEPPDNKDLFHLS